MIALEDVSFSYGAAQILTGITMSLPEGTTTAILGRSGRGKTTMLNLAAGLRLPTSGKVTRGAGEIALTSQHPTLLPWLSVQENVALPFRVVRSLAGVPAKAVGRSIAVALERFAIAEASRQYPDQLSGGMRARASLARATAYGASYIFLDEAFSMLDEPTRAICYAGLDAYRAETGCTVVFATHDVEQAVLLADRVLVLGGAAGAGLGSTIVTAIQLPRGRGSATAWRQSEQFSAAVERVRAAILADGAA